MLDVVTYIQRHLDPTLSYRFACRVGMCGSCAMTVNAMFLGHLGVAFAAKKVAPEVSAGTTMLAACFLDVAWPPPSVGVLAGSSLSGVLRAAWGWWVDRPRMPARRAS